MNPSQLFQQKKETLPTPSHLALSKRRNLRKSSDILLPHTLPTLRTRTSLPPPTRHTLPDPTLQARPACRRLMPAITRDAAINEFPIRLRRLAQDARAFHSRGIAARGRSCAGEICSRGAG